MTDVAPHGARGLKCISIEAQWRFNDVAPHGARGLKYPLDLFEPLDTLCRAPRGAWIEMPWVLVKGICRECRAPRGAWIEMIHGQCGFSGSRMSRPTGRVD